MTFTEAIAQQPSWVGIWLNILAVGVFALPVVLLFWRASRITAIFVLLSNVASFASISWLYNQLGYVKLLGLPHIILWTPLVILLVVKIRQNDMPVWPRRIMGVVAVVMLISLAFDYADTARYLLGERTATILPPAV